MGAGFADELDLVREVGAEEGVLAGAGRSDAGAGDVAGPGEGGVEAGRGEARLGVAILQVVTLHRIADRHGREHGKRQAGVGVPPPGQMPP